MTHEIKQRLDDVAGYALGTTDLWPGIQRRATHRTRLARWMPATRLGWAALAAVAVVLLGSVAYAAAPLLTDVYRINPTWSPEASELSHPLSVSQTRDGCTVTLEQIYVDQERILIGLNVIGPGEMSLAPTGAILRTEDGLALPFVDGAGHAEPGAAAHVLAFDATPLGELSDPLTLEFSFGIHAIPVGEAAPPMAPPEHASDQSLAVVLSPIETTLFGPYRFRISVPTAGDAR